MHKSHIRANCSLNAHEIDLCKMTFIFCHPLTITEINQSINQPMYSWKAHVKV